METHFPLVYRDPEHDVFREYRGRDQVSGVSWHSDIVSRTSFFFAHSERY